MGHVLLVSQFPSIKLEAEKVSHNECGIRPNGRAPHAEEKT